MKRVALFSILLLVCAVISLHCSRSPYAATNKMYKKQVKAFARIIRQVPPADSVTMGNPWIGTVNFNMRKPNFVIIHHTAQNSCDQTLKTFTLVKTQVSAHYVICKDGTIHHMLNDYLRAWQAGISKWGNVTDINSSSIGIELDNDAFVPFTEPQIISLLQVLAMLKKTYTIPAANFIGHGDIAPARKNDPNVYFPWKRLADKGFGLWYGDTTSVTVPDGFKALQALRIVGYDIKDSSAAVEAFKRHFLQQDKSKEFTDSDLKVLYTLYQNYQ